MAQMTLVVGDKNLSSWSLRPYLAISQTGTQFNEVKIRLDQPDTKQRIAEWSPSGRVPVLKDGDVAIWESLAICEYLAERFPEARLWPQDRIPRAIARAVSAEMHAGFMDLRRTCPMRAAERLPTPELSPAVQADVARLFTVWRTCRERFGHGGPFLFGHFTIADAMYAPVVLRLVTYAIGVEPQDRAYMDAVLALPAMQRWLAGAKQEISG